MTRRAILSLVLLTLVLSAVLAVPVSTLQQQGLVVNTTAGPVRGFVKHGANTFFSVPFGEDTSGNNRLRAPQPVQPWTDTRDCTSRTFAVKHICPQLQPLAGHVLGSEDCLFSHVFTPAAHNVETDGLLPVMFWIYGGAYVIGDGNEFHLYNAAKLAEQQNVMVVAPNYRLEALGFFSAEALKNEQGANNSTGNYALQDQRLALEWVQQNAKAFGGNPDQVTIFGESAGAISVCWHLASPGSGGLFHNAIMESGSCDTNFFFQPYHSATKFSSEWAAANGCTQTGDSSDAEYLKCLRALPTKAFIHDSLVKQAEGASTQVVVNVGHRAGARANGVTALQQMGLSASVASAVVPPLFPTIPWGPVIDGSDEALPDVPTHMFASGRFNKVPTIIGTNRDEGSIFVPLVAFIVPGATWPLADADFDLFLEWFFDNDAARDRVKKAYPSSAYSSQDRRGAAVLRDMFFVCGSRRAARLLAAASVPVWQYHFTFDYGGPLYPLLGNFHMSELPFVFDDSGFPWASIVGLLWGPEHIRVSSMLERYWSDLARFGSPNGGGTEPSSPSSSTTTTTSTTTTWWPAYNATDDAYLELNDPAVAKSHLYSDICDMWDGTPTKPW